MISCPAGPHPSICPDCPEAFPCAVCGDVEVANDGDMCAECGDRLDAFIDAVRQEEAEVFA